MEYNHSSHNQIVYQKVIRKSRLNGVCNKLELAGCLPPVHAAGMNIVAAQRQYRWPKANIVFAAGKNIVLQYTSPPNNKAGIGEPPPNARKSSSELISSPARSCRQA
ncbi:MAG: hypothetical protein IKJ29_00100 [Akkermansia sp.]|nr:hypothetical protein [Akkermansia sp.]